MMASTTLPSPFVVPDQVLRMASYKSLKRRLSEARFSFTLLGKGSSRSVFSLGGYVLKVAHSQAGIAQNKTEADERFKPYYGDLLAGIVACCSRGYWLIQQRVDSLSPIEFAKLDMTPQWTVFRRQVTLLARINNLVEIDLTRRENIGLRGGRLCIADFGGSQSVFESFYRPAPGQYPLFM